MTRARSARPFFVFHPSCFVLLVALTGAPTGAPVTAQELADPTRPPAELAAKAPAVEGAVNQLHQLQSVIISPKRKAAIIDGVVVELGAKYGDAVLTRVAEDEVVLKSGDSREVLKLYPAVGKVDITPAAKSAPRKTKPKANPNAATDGGIRAH
jgi:hypothetical protein